MSFSFQLNAKSPWKHIVMEKVTSDDEKVVYKLVMSCKEVVEARVVKRWSSDEVFKLHEAIEAAKTEEVPFYQYLTVHGKDLFPDRSFRSVYARRYDAAVKKLYPTEDEPEAAEKEDEPEAEEKEREEPEAKEDEPLSSDETESAASTPPRVLKRPKHCHSA